MNNTTTYTGKEIKNAYYQANKSSFDLMITMAGAIKKSINIRRNKKNAAINISYSKSEKYMNAMNKQIEGGYFMDFNLPSEYDIMNMTKEYIDGALYLSFALKGDVLIDGIPTPTPVIEETPEV